MDTASLADAEARLSELIDRVEAGASINITGNGKPVARPTAVGAPRKRIDVAMLRSLTATRTASIESGSDIIRAMRDGDRY